jgi:hypothetical protein
LTLPKSHFRCYPLRQLRRFVGTQFQFPQLRLATVASKAAQGHALARHALRQMNSREHRIYNALFDAAVDAHPGWERGKKEGHYRKVRKDAPEDLVEWFQMTYPSKARAIEDAIT